MFRTIKGGKFVRMFADKDRATLVLVLNPSANGGNFTIELPRNIIDSKGASNADTKYQVKIDSKGVDYKEVANYVNGRILSIDFSKDNRFIEIIGTQLTSRLCKTLSHGRLKEALDKPAAGFTRSER